MQWVLLAVIVAALIYLSRYFPKIAFAILGVLIIGATAIVFTTTDFAINTRSRLPVEDIVIENPIMTASYGGGYRFSARFNNTNDSIELRESIVSITMLDCPGDSDDDCSVIGQEEERVILRIPPAQARDVSKTISFGAAQPQGSVRWKFKITETRS
jgi:hypothetical protein